MMHNWPITDDNFLLLKLLVFWFFLFFTIMLVNPHSLMCYHILTFDFRVRVIQRSSQSRWLEKLHSFLLPNSHTNSVDGDTKSTYIQYIFKRAFFFNIKISKYRQSSTYVSYKYELAVHAHYSFCAPPGSASSSEKKQQVWYCSFLRVFFKNSFKNCMYSMFTFFVFTVKYVQFSACLTLVIYANYCIDQVTTRFPGTNSGHTLTTACTLSLSS